MNEFFTWAFLASFAGAALATAILTQAFKEVFDKIPTQIVSYIISLLVLLLATFATGDLGQPWTEWAIIPLNALLVSLSSNGAFAAVKRAAG